MFRFGLAIVIGTSFGFVLLFAAALYWGSNEVAKHFQRSQRSHEAFVLYEHLSQDAYRYFKQQLDRLTTAMPGAHTDVEASRRRLYKTLQALKDEVIKTPTNSLDRLNKPIELTRVAKLSAFLDTSEYRFNQIERLLEQGKVELALQALSKFSGEEIDIDFQSLIDEAISAEQMKAVKAKRELETLVVQSHWFAILASVAAALFCISSGLLLLRRVKKPIESLMKGTNEIASGNLNYRINLHSEDEFSYLASHFNKMAFELELQQEKLREGRAELETRVAERTYELNQLNAKLKRMDAERRQFLADISHELRTPITVIRGEAEVTLRGTDRDSEEYKETLQRIIELSMQLGTYVNDLLFLTRIESANMQFEYDRVNLTELVSSTIEDFKVMAEENALTVSFDKPTQEIWISADKQRLRQVLFILGDNACRYSRPSGRINIVLHKNDKETHFSLADQGIGIPHDELAHIFERHFRCRNARQLRNDGTGLGLPLAKSIINAHGGRIVVDSTENIGTTFTVTLPLISNEPE
ncbi:MAG: sensor histidine kinase [Gammaproteobacteria bacterium]